jgi:hypothetical protein
MSNPIVTQAINSNVLAELARLQAENEALKAKTARKVRPITLKVSEKKAVSVYGLHRFPVTLYKEQWKRLLSVSEEIQSFIASNSDQLKSDDTSAV